METVGSGPFTVGGAEGRRRLYRSQRTLAAVLVVESAAWIALVVHLLLSEDPPNGLVSSTVAHVLLFTAVSGTITAAQLVRGAAPRRLLVVILGLALVAVATEVAQDQVTAARRGTAGDVAADVVGIAAGAVGVLALRSLSRRLVAPLTAAASLAALFAVGAVMVVSAPSIQARWLCRAEDQLGVLPALDAGTRPVLTIGDDHVRTVRGSAPLRLPVALADATALWCAGLVAGELSVVAQVDTDDQFQEGPTRIVSSSVGTGSDQVNFHLGQEGDALSVRLRTGDGRLQSHLIAGVFTDVGSRTVALTIGGGRAEVFVEGERVAQVEIGERALLHWDLGYPLLVGDELTGDRTFVGSIDHLAVYAGGLPARAAAGD